MNNSPEAYLAGRGTWATTPETMARDRGMTMLKARTTLTKLFTVGRARRIKPGYYVHVSVGVAP